MAAKKVPITLRLTPRMLKAIETEAKRLQISNSDVIRRWIEPETDKILASERGLAAALYRPS